MYRLIGVWLLFSATALAQPAPTAQPAPAPADPQRQLAEFEARMGVLKQEVFETKARLTALEKAVGPGALDGANVRLVHRNEMGASFTLEKVVYSLDGTTVLEQVDNGGDLDDRTEFEVFSGPVAPGKHTVSVQMVYRGNGFGIFSYLEGYVFTLRSSHTFHADEGKQLDVTTVGYEKGGATTDLADRPAVRFEDALRDVEPAPGG